MMAAEILSLINLILSVLILAVIFMVYSVYKRVYLLWFILSFSIVPFIFAYSLIWSPEGMSKMGVVVYPISVIVIEISMLIAQKNLISSIKSGEEEEYQILLRDDVAILRGYEQLANFFISRIVPLIGTNSIKELLESRIEKYPVLSGSYIGVDERLNTSLKRRLTNSEMAQEG